VRHETEQVLNKQLKELGYSIDDIDNYIQNEGEVEEMKEEHGEELSGYKEYRLPVYIAERENFRRCWREKVKECFDYYITCYQGRSERIRVKTQIIQYEQDKDEPTHPVAEDLAGLDYDFRHIGDVKENFSNLESWDEREKAICQLYKTKNITKREMTGKTFKYSDLETDEYYEQRINKIYKKNNMFEYKFSDRTEMTKEKAKEEMEKARCEETEKEIMRMYIEHLRGRTAKEYTTEKFESLLSKSILLLPLNHNYRDKTQHLIEYDGVRKRNKHDSMIVIKPR
jgi:hypothetical protein